MKKLQFSTNTLFYIVNGTIHSCSVILTGTYTHNLLSGAMSNDIENSAKFSTARSVAQPLCNSWAACMPL